MPKMIVDFTAEVDVPDSNDIERVLRDIAGMAENGVRHMADIYFQIDSFEIMESDQLLSVPFHVRLKKEQPHGNS